jgi:hypothetical protein
MQIRFEKILEREFKFDHTDDSIEKKKILEILMQATGKSNSYIQNHLGEYLQGDALIKFNGLLKSLKRSSR